MSWQFLFHSLAKEDYKEAYLWYEDKLTGLGERFGKAVRNKLDQISNNPEAFGSRDNKKFREAKIEFFPYLIIFKIKKRSKVIYISSLHHASKQTHKKYRK